MSEREPWPIRVLLQSGLAQSGRQAERYLLVAITIILLVTLWTFMKGNRAGPDPSGEPNPVAEYLKR